MRLMYALANKLPVLKTRVKGGRLSRADVPRCGEMRAGIAYTLYIFSICPNLVEKSWGTLHDNPTIRTACVVTQIQSEQCPNSSSVAQR